MPGPAPDRLSVPAEALMSCKRVPLEIRPASRGPASAIAGRFGRRVGLIVGVVAVVSSSVVGLVDAAALPADGPTTTITTAVVTAPVTDQTPLPPLPPEADPSPHIRVLLTRIAVLDARVTLTRQRRSAVRARDDQMQPQAALDAATQVQSDAERRWRTSRDHLDSSAVYAYMHVSGNELPSLPDGSTAGGRERELLAASIDEHRFQLADAREAVVRAGARVGTAQGALDRAKQAAADQDRRVASSSRALDDASDHLRAASADEALPAPTSWQLTLEGPSAFTAEELAQWYEAQGQGSQASVPIATLARSYIEQGNAEGIRGDMAFAQSIHETGWFANNDTIAANNFAGIGHCSACAGGVAFFNARIGVLAQIQLLKSYADADPIYHRPRAAPTLNGPSGCCQTWTELSGVWASDPGYGNRILTYYAGMLEWLVAKRTAAA